MPDCSVHTSIATLVREGHVQTISDLKGNRKYRRMLHSEDRLDSRQVSWNCTAVTIGELCTEICGMWTVSVIDFIIWDGYPD